MFSLRSILQFNVLFSSHQRLPLGKHTASTGSNQSTSSIMASQAASTGSSNYIKNVAIVGAAGQVGSYITASLLETSKFIITAITRSDSTSKIPDGVKSAKVDYNDHASLVAALRGQDCLIITMNTMAPRDTSAKLIQAAAEAEVPWVLPNEWGYDSGDEELAKDAIVGAGNIVNRQLISKLGMSSWIAVVSGFWYEYSLGSSPVLYGFDFKNRAVTFYDDGERKTNTTTWDQTGMAVASLLSLKVRPDSEDDQSSSLSQFKNGFCYISSFKVSQKDMFESILRVTGTKESDWQIKYEDVKKRYEDGVKEFDGGKGSRLGFGKLMYARVFFPDGCGCFEDRRGLHNDLLGLPNEDFDAATKKAVKRGEEGPQWGT